jgi:hypothetical protein
MRLATTINRDFPPEAPAVHLNGTNGMDLYENLGRVTEALEAARELLKRAAPNGRDYYVKPNRNGHAALELAVAQHDRRLAVVQALIDEIQEEQGLIVDQMPATLPIPCECDLCRYMES